jgi:hypothetical protein
MRSYMERQLTTASVPIVRYYDHLRIVYEVEASMRELRGETESQDNGPDSGPDNGNDQQQKQTQPVTPGETREIRDQVNNGTREQVRLTPLAPLFERSTPWIA